MSTPRITAAGLVLASALGLAALAASADAAADPPHRHHHHGGVRMVANPWVPWYAPPPWTYAPRVYVPPVVIVRPAPVYVEQPQLAAVPPQEDRWFYCDAAGAYYPYVQECPGGWRQVAPQPPAPPQ